MGSFNRKNNFSDRGGRRSFGDRDSERKEMHWAVCSDCGKDCEVPFKPTGSKPVFCSDCFRGKENDDSRSYGGGRDSGRSSRRDSGRFDSRDRDRQMFKVVCDKCGKNCEVPFKPSSDKPVYCSECFEQEGGNSARGGGSKGNGLDALVKQIEAMNKKLDQVLQNLNPAVTAKVKKEVKVAEVEEVKAPKEAKKTKTKAVKKETKPKTKTAEKKKTTKKVAKKK